VPASTRLCRYSASTFNSLSRDHSITTAKNERIWSSTSFNSLSRDHVRMRVVIGRNKYYCLSTPSLGITLGTIR